MSDRRSIPFAARTHAGRVRDKNEDAWGADPGNATFVVCDGMGGAAGGEVAAEEAARAFLANASQMHLDGSAASSLRAAIQSANRAVFAHARSEPRLAGMGTTLIAIHLDPANQQLWTAHVGDSRCYRLRAGSLTRLTRDHSWVEEQVDSGQMAAQVARLSPHRNLITRVVGVYAEVEPEVHRFSTEPGDLYLLSSDGLTLHLEEEAIALSLLNHEEELDTACEALIAAANDAGGGDNVTVLLVRCPSP